MENRNPQPRRRKPRSPLSDGLVRLLLGLFLFMFILMIAASCQHVSSTIPEQDSTEDTTPSTTESTEPSGPYVVSTASIGVTGDILIHGPVIRAGAAAAGSSDSYDFTDMFAYVKPYYESFDYMVANLETTLGGSEAGAYQGWPKFNCPDSMVDALLGAGVDMLLTSNNHSYDTLQDGMLRTQKVLDEKGMDYLGTRTGEDMPFYTVVELNGIKIGMICYTYEDSSDGSGKKIINDTQLTEDASALISSFSYDNLPAFYTNVQNALQAMAEDGAEATMLFIHWGNEYELSPSERQKTIAQKLCDMGVDVIVGGHPHVQQPMDILTSESGNTTYCFYSLGNALSNQNRVTLDDTPNCEYTEDGIILGIEFRKWDDGKVEISTISALPTWINKETHGTADTYRIIPLDVNVEAWNIYDAENVSRTTESYNRTMKLIGEGLNKMRQALGLDSVPTSVSDDKLGNAS